MAVNARIANCRTAIGDVVVDLGRHVQFGCVVEVFGREVVEGVFAPAHPGHPDLPQRAGFDCAVGHFEHTAFQFAAVDAPPPR